MRKLLAFATLITLAAMPGFAKTMSFPSKGDLMFTINVPDNWTPEKDEDHIVTAVSPSEKLTLTVWELESEADVKTLIPDIKEMFKDDAKNIKIEAKPAEAHPGGMDGLLYKGTAVSKEDNQPIEIYTLLIRNGGKAAVVLIEADGDAPKKEAESLQEILASIKPPASKAAKKDGLLRAAVAVDGDTPPASTFKSDLPKLYCFVVGDKLKEGDKVRGVWIGEDVGDVAPRNTKIDEVSYVAKSAKDATSFTLSKPTAGWPIGKYRVEIYVNDTLAETVPFTMVKP